MVEIIAPIIALGVAALWDYKVAPSINNKRFKKALKEKDSKAEAIFINPSKLSK